MYGMLYGMVWPYLQHENMVWYGSIASLIHTHWGMYVHQAYITEQLNLFYMIIGLTHYERQTSCT